MGGQGEGGGFAFQWACDLLHTLSRVQVPEPPELLLTQGRQREAWEAGLYWLCWGL